MRRAVVLLLAASTLLDSATAASAAPVASLKAMADDMNFDSDMSDDGLSSSNDIRFSDRVDAPDIIEWLRAGTRSRGRINHLGLGWKYGDAVIAPLHEGDALADLLDKNGSVAAMVVLGYEQGDAGVLAAAPELHARGVSRNHLPRARRTRPSVREVRTAAAAAARESPESPDRRRARETPSTRVM